MVSCRYSGTRYLLWVFSLELLRGNQCTVLHHSLVHSSQWRHQICWFFLFLTYTEFVRCPHDVRTAHGTCDLFQTWCSLYLVGFDCGLNRKCNSLNVYRYIPKYFWQRIWVADINSVHGRKNSFIFTLQTNNVQQILWIVTWRHPPCRRLQTIAWRPALVLRVRRLRQGHWGAGLWGPACTGQDPCRTYRSEDRREIQGRTRNTLNEQVWPYCGCKNPVACRIRWKKWIWIYT